jgi:hypothetical protein
LRLEILTDVTRSLPFGVDLSKAQNICYELLERIYPEKRQQSEREDLDASEWIAHLFSLAEKLGVRTSKAQSATG